MREMLTLLGFRVSCARNGETACKEYLDAMTSDPFNLVFLDLTTPDGMGGKECLDKMKAIDPNVTAIVLSGQYDDEAMWNFASYGFKDRLDKPCTIDKVESVISKAMGLASERGAQP